MNFLRILFVLDVISVRKHYRLLNSENKVTAGFKGKKKWIKI